MKAFTPFLLKFIVTATVLTFLFRYFLSTGIENHSKALILISSITYGILMFVAGWYFGRKDAEYLPIYDVGFRSHLSTYIIHNGISIAWVGLGFGSKHEILEVTFRTAIIWGIFLIIHFIFYLWARKHSIDNLSKEDIFD